MDTATLITTILTAGGGGAALLALINGLIKWLTGAASRERIRNKDASTQRVEAIAERDAAYEKLEIESRKKRDAYEYASILRRQLRENGIRPKIWPNKYNFQEDGSEEEDTIPSEFRDESQ